MSSLTNPRWVDSALRVVQVLLNAAVALWALLLLHASDRVVGNTGQLFVLLFAVFLAPLLALVVHEAGHFAAARWAGLWVLSVRVGAIEWLARRRGWRGRWFRQPGPTGLVFAIARQNQPLRKNFLVFYAGGSVANLLLAAIAAAMAAQPVLTMGGMLWQIVALWNALLGLVNLLPISAPCVHDGRHLLFWLARPDEQGDLLVLTRLLAAELAGQTAVERSGSDLGVLATQPLPLPLVSLFIRVRALQETGEWQSIAALAELAEEQIGALPPAMAGGMPAYLELLRAEIAFGRAAAASDARALPDSLSPSAQWFNRALWPRCEALRAALHGDPVACERHLHTASAEASDTLNAHAVRSEAAVAEQVRQIAMRPAAIAAAPAPA